MTRTRFTFTLVPLSVLMAAAMAATPAQAAMRPIQEFVNAQGTYCIHDGGGGC